MKHKELTKTSMIMLNPLVYMVYAKIMTLKELKKDNSSKPIT